MRRRKLTLFYILMAMPALGQSTAEGDFTSQLGNQASTLNINQRSNAELKYGIEAVTTWRSEYVYRGFALAGNSMEFQLAGQMALSNDSAIDVGLFYGTATSDGDFSEFGGFVDYSKVVGKYTYAVELALRDYSQSTFKSGADLGGSVNCQINEAFGVSGSASYDTGAEGFHFESKLSYFEQVNDDSYLVLDAGISAVVDYYGRNGFHHAFSKLAYTYNINDSVSVTPYVSANLGIHSKTKNHLFGGVYFAVSF